MPKHSPNSSSRNARRAAAARWAKAPDRPYQLNDDSPALARVTLLTRTQVAEVLGISPWTLADWVKKGTFPKPLRLSPGHAQKWRLVDLEIWLQRKSRKPAEKPALRGAVKVRREGGNR